LEETENGTYDSASIHFKEIISSYPDSKCAQASMKQLFYLEEFHSSNYESLINYFESDSTILNNTDLDNIAEFLVNFCELKLENWPVAIDWFEDVILDPESFEDSVFAIIDLGYTYLLMENSGLKSNYSGKLSENKPASKNDFEKRRDFLLSLLPGDQLSASIDKTPILFSSGRIIQYNPNPCDGITKVLYEIESESIVKIQITNITGRIINSYVEGLKMKGLHNLTLNMENLTAGIYICSLYLNENLVDTKKIILLK
jgi:hypothetical protein